MQTKTKSTFRILALLMTLVLLVGFLPMPARAAADAKPEKITLVGSDDALTYEFVDYLYYSWEEIPRYKVSVPESTTQVQLHGTVYVDASAGSGYCSEADLDMNAMVYKFEYWTADTVGAAAPYTIETRTDGTKPQNLSFVKLKSSVSGSSDAFILQFEAQKAANPSNVPTLTQDLSAETVTYTSGDAATALAVTATGSGTLTYQWQVSTTSGSDGFADIPDATSSSYTSSTETPGSYWYRAIVSNTDEGKDPASVTSTATLVVVNAVTGKYHVTITTSIGYRTSEPMTFTVTGPDGNPLALEADTTSGYAVYDFYAAPGTYTYQATAVKNEVTYVLGTDSFEVIESSELQELELYLVYVYASSSGWTGDDFTTEVKNSAGTVVKPGQPYKFASYVAYPYLIPAGSYTYQILPSETRAAEGYLPSTVLSKTLNPQKTYTTWSTKLAQQVSVSFTVPKGAELTVTTAPAKPYNQGTEVAGTADTTGENDVYTFSLTAGSAYVYRASGTGLLTNSGVIDKAAKATIDLTGTMGGSPSAIVRDGSVDTADIRLSGVDATGSLALPVGGKSQITPLRLWQIGNNSAATNKASYALEPDFHYSVVNLEGSNVVSVAEDGTITANSAGTALVLVTYDAIHTGTMSWTDNQNKTFSAIWPENTGVVVVEVGDNASGGPATGLTIGTGTQKVSGTSLDAESDVIYYTGSQGSYTFTPTPDATVSVLNPSLSGSAVSYGGFSPATAHEDGSVTVALTEGRNIVKVSDGTGSSYQVITAKPVQVEISNLSTPGGEILPGDKVQVKLTGIYHPVGNMGYLYNFSCRVSYADPSGASVSGKALSSKRYLFDTTSGDQCRTFTLTIPTDWDAKNPYVLTEGTLLMGGNGKSVGSHRTGLTSLGSSTPYASSFTLGALPEITVPVVAPKTGTLTFAVQDDLEAAVEGATVTLTNQRGNDTRTLDTSLETSIALPVGSWTYTVTKAGYLNATGTVVVEEAPQTLTPALALVTDIHIASLPTKTEYVEGTKLDTDGLVVEAVTRTGNVALEKSAYTVSPTKVLTIPEETITVSYESFTKTFSVTVTKEIIDLTTTLTDRDNQRNSRLTFDVFAKDASGNKLAASRVSVTLNGKEVGVNWDDSTKTSYTLNFTQPGDNVVVVAVNSTKLTYHINYIKVEEGQPVGKAVVSFEAFTLGGGYIVEPVYVDILQGENGAMMLDRLITANSMTYSSTGSLESGFYLSILKGDQLAAIDVTGNSIPAELKEMLTANYFTISKRDNATELGEFDYTYGSGWMVCVNNVFPNVGFSDIYLSEGDVLRLQFTLAYGSDIGGGYAMGSGGGTSYYPLANKDALTARVAEINALKATDAQYLAKNNLTEAYNNAMAVLTNLTSGQETVDAALAALNKPTTEPEEPVAPTVTGYTVAAGEAVSVNVAETAKVTLTIGNTDETAYNAYHLTVSYDTDKLSYTGINTDATVKDADGTLTISGYGADRTCGTDNLELSFTAKVPGETAVTVLTANIDKSANAVTEDAPAATLTQAAATVIIGGYTVDLSEDFTGPGAVAPNADYTFTARDPHYDYTFADTTMGGEKAEVTDNGDGTFTIKNVTGNLIIRDTKTPKSYQVTVTGDGASEVIAPATATYLTDFSFTLEEDSAYNYQLTVTVGGETLVATAENGGYTIPGASVTGDIVITVEKSLKPVTTTTVNFTGSGSADVVGGTSQTADIGQSFSFTITRAEGYDYTVTLAGEDLQPDETGTYTIPGESVTAAPITVTVEKTGHIDLEVSSYIELDGKTIWLVTASGTVTENMVLAYDGSAMFWSDKYQAYCYLVISDQALDAVKAEAKVSLGEASAEKVSIVYDCNVNGSQLVDINDAQLTYDMYNGKYASFEAVSMVKFLRADTNGDKVVNTADAVAIVHSIK